MKEKILFTWSGGKDSALALYELQQNPEVDVVALLTTLTKDYDRICMHGVKRTLLEQQAASLGIPLEKVFINKDAANTEYETAITEVLNRYKALGVNKVAFGDLFLEDVRQYRIDQLNKVDMTPIFPLWGIDTREVAARFIRLGFKAILTCVDTEQLDGKFSGSLYNEELLAELPPKVDCCGENGEFHSFVFDGPNFKQNINFTIGEVVLRDERYNFCDLI